MSDVIRVELFVEDQAHEQFLVPLVERVGREENVVAHCRIRSARGGHGRATHEFKTYQDLWNRGHLSDVPDLLVVSIDSNCQAFAQTRSEIESATRTEFRDLLVTACPNPHIERWFMADPDSFHAVVGHRPALGPEKYERGPYKNELKRAVEHGGHPQTLGGIEFALPLVTGMNLYRAGRTDSSLKAFVDELRAKLRGIRRRERG